MISTLETGYFMWNFTAWVKIFLLSAVIFCFLIYVIKKKTGGNLISSKKMREYGEDQDEVISEQRTAMLRSKIMGPWFDFPFLHLLSMVLLFLLFAVALFSGSGVE